MYRTYRCGSKSEPRVPNATGGHADQLDQKSEPTAIVSTQHATNKATMLAVVLDKVVVDA